MSKSINRFHLIRGNTIVHWGGSKLADKIGDVLIRIGAMKKYQVEDVLRVQKAGNKSLFGEIAIAFGYINDDAIKRYIDYIQMQEGKSDS